MVAQENPMTSQILAYVVLFYSHMSCKEDPLWNVLYRSPKSSFFFSFFYLYMEQKSILKLEFYIFRDLFKTDGLAKRWGEIVHYVVRSTTISLALWPMEDSGRSMHRLQRPVVWILCLVFSMFGRISGYFLLGIIGLFWFHFERIAPSEWLYLPLCIFKCKESRPVKHHNPAVNSKWGTLIVPLGFERLDFFISGFFNIFFRETLFKLQKLLRTVNDKTHTTVTAIWGHIPVH